MPPPTERPLARLPGKVEAILRAKCSPPRRQLAGNLHIGDLLRIAERPGEEGLAAQRCLNSLYSALSFYLPQEDLPRGRYVQVATSYELSLMIRDDNAVVWYNLACVRALLGRKADAVAALASALEHGFARYDLLETDTDLDPLRVRERVDRQASGS